MEHHDIYEDIICFLLRLTEIGNATVLGALKQAPVREKLILNFIAATEWMG